MHISLCDVDCVMDAYLRLQSGVYLLRLLEEDVEVEAGEDFDAQINATTRGYVIEGLVARLQDMSAVLGRLQRD